MDDEDGRTLTYQPSGFRAHLPASAAARADRDASPMMDDGELRFLAATALAFPWTPEALVVEIGTYAGSTAAFVAETLAEAGVPNPILSIDPFERVASTRKNPQGKYRRYLRTIQGRGVAERCFPLVAYSQHAFGVVPDRIGLLIIDGDHAYDSVAGDLARYAPKVLSGGFIFLDDYTDTYPGVMRATDEHAAAHRDWEVLHRSYFAVLRRAD